MEIVAAILEGQTVTDIGTYFMVDVDQFYGIEYEEFPAQIAQVAMWLMDHQMNIIASQRFGDYYVRLPLRKSATIVHGNALRIDWQSLIQVMPWEKEEPSFDFIMGNPPFIGKKEQSQTQKDDITLVFNSNDSTGILDYVTGWYKLSAKYLEKYSKKEIKEQSCRVAFVSTNSITQGEQVPILWNDLFYKHRIKINFAHRTFKWGNEAKGKANVHVVIIGFSNINISNKKIFDYENVNGDPIIIPVKNINPYLVEGKDIFLQNRKKPISDVPEMNYGSMPIDNGNLVLNEDDYASLIKESPANEIFTRIYFGGEEFINSKRRWCLWLDSISPHEYRNSTFIMKRIQNNKQFRLESKRAATNKLAAYPGLFGEIRQPVTNYIFIPKVSSETREYIPIGILQAKIISSGSALIIPNADFYAYGVMQSNMHMAWMRSTCGRMKSDYQYSASIVYNNFPWPLQPTDKQKQAVEVTAQAVLAARLLFPDSSLADLYDPNTMPPDLVKAHQALDKAVDLCYRPQPFINETKRIEYLFELYDQYTAGLFKTEKKKKK
jgi:hypothetical protein